MKKNDEYYIQKALNEAYKAYNIDEIPVGAVLVRNYKIISKGYNKRDLKNIIINHAEIEAIIKANRKEKNWRLLGTILYTTLEPCEMCKEVIKEARVEKVVYGAKRKKSNNKHEDNYFQINNKDLIYKCGQIINNKFFEIRKKNKN